jgi:hypothetical protein
MDMAEAILKKLDLVGKDVVEVESILGKPDGKTTKQEGPWTLWIDCETADDEARSFIYRHNRSYNSPYLTRHTVKVRNWDFIYF